MSGTFTSWGALVQALQKEVAEATEEVVNDSLDDLYRNVDRFYSSSEGRYHRTGMLRMSPQSYFSGGGSVSTGEISDFDFKNASGFYSGLNNLSDTVTKNAKIVQGKTGIYDDFFNYFKDKKIYVSDELKKAMGGDAYKELLQNNIGMMNQVDQITHAFDLMKQARADMTQSFSVSDLKGADFTAMTDSIAEQVLAAGTQLKDALQTNLMSATEAAKTMIDLDVEVNTEKIASDIRSAVQSAGTEAGESRLGIRGKKATAPCRIRSTGKQSFVPRYLLVH